MYITFGSISLTLFLPWFGITSRQVINTNRASLIYLIPSTTQWLNRGNSDGKQLHLDDHHRDWSSVLNLTNGRILNCKRLPTGRKTYSVPGRETTQHSTRN
ncbi:hypothetical protein EV426DRAFT_591016, partial [Tirmania nivea]